MSRRIEVEFKGATSAELRDALREVLDALDRMKTPIMLSQRVEVARGKARALVPKNAPPCDPDDIATLKDGS